MNVEQNPWNDPDKRTLLSQLHRQAESRGLSKHYWRAVVTDAFMMKCFLQERVDPFDEPIEPRSYFTRLRVLGYPIVPFTEMIADKEMLEVCQVDSETGVMMPLTNLTVATRTSVNECFRSLHGDFSFHIVNLLGAHAAKLSDAELIPIQVKR